MVSNRKRINTFQWLKEINDSQVSTHGEMADVVKVILITFFNLMGQRLRLQSLTLLHPKHDNNLFARDFQAKEARDASFQMNLQNTPCADGMSPYFFHRIFWVIHVLILALIFLIRMSFLMSLILPTQSLSLKKSNPQSMGDLTPISLCNVICKFISKVLANRLKVILPHIMAPNQSAFIPSRLITNNCLVAYESLHFLKNKRRGQEGFLCC